MKRKMVSLLWVTYPDGKWKVVSLLRVTYPRKCKDFFKKMVSLLWVTYLDEKKSGLIVIGDLPKWKVESGLIVTGDLPKKMQRFFSKK
jgi:hypothetical protein